MNIFALDNDPTLAAQWQHDRHVVKMILESAQMLSTSVPDLLPTHFHSLAYKRTHVNHPCNLWTSESWHNAAWLTIHGNALVAEYHRRFGKVHATTDLLRGFMLGLVAKVGCDRAWIRDDNRQLMLNPALVNFANQHTPFAVCMPDEYKSDILDNGKGDGIKSAMNDAAIQSYRTLYRESKIFQSHVKWTKCDSLPAFILKARDGMPVESATRKRINDLVIANCADATERKRQLYAPLHPDLAKPANPKALTRFGTSSK